MKYLDSNVVIRMITGDIPELARQAIAAIERATPRDYNLVDAVIVEVCFVLEFHDYAMKRSDIADALLTIISTPQIAVTDNTVAALALYRQHSKLDYADCLLYVLGGKQGVMTFDKQLQQTLLT